MKMESIIPKLKSILLFILIFIFLFVTPLFSIALQSEGPCPCKQNQSNLLYPNSSNNSKDILEDYTREKGYGWYLEAHKDWRAKKWNSALEKYQNIIKDHPKSHWAARSHMDVGLYLKYTKYWDEAIDEFQKGIDLIPNTRSAHDAKTSIACIHNFRGDFKTARKMLKDILVETKDWDQVKYCSYWLKEIKRREAFEGNFHRISCGPRALSLLFKQRGIESSPEEIGNLLSTKSLSISMQDLKNAALAKGLKVEGYKGIGLDQLNQIELPAIAFVRPGHYIMVNSLDKDGYEIIDPFLKGEEPFRIKDKKCLENEWTGYLLLTFNEESSPSSDIIQLTEKEMIGIKGGVCFCCPESDLGGPEENSNTEFSDGGDACAPGGGQSPGMPSIKVNTVNLNFIIQDVDLSFGNFGPRVEIKRTYNSDSSEDSVFGHSWTYNYNIRLVENPGGGVDIMREEGGTHQYTSLGDGTYLPPLGVYDILTKHADGSFSLLIKKDKTTQWFNPEGILQRISDQNGNSLVFQYDVNSRLNSITDAAGRITILTYNANGRIEAITDPLGRQATYTYDGFGNLITTIDMAGNTVTYTYNGNSYITGITNSQGTIQITYKYSYEGYGLETITYQNGNTYTYNNSSDYLVVITDPREGVTQYLNTYEGFTKSITDPLGYVTTYDYDDQGNRILIQDGNGHVTHLGYDDRGNIINIEDPLSHIYSYSYDESDNLISRTSPAPYNYTYTYGYDLKNNLISILNHQNNQTIFTYNPQGLLTSIINFRGYTTTFTYDTQGNLYTIENSLGDVTTFSYDAIGRILSVTDARGHSVSYSYDGIDRIVRVTYPDGTYEDYNYYCCGLDSITDRNGRTTSLIRDSVNRLTEVVDALNQHTIYQYDETGNRISVLDAKNQETFYNYDLAERLFLEGKGDVTPQTYFFDDIESGQSNWTVDPPWDITESESKSPTNSFTDSPDGNYQNNLDISLYLITQDFSSNFYTTLTYWTKSFLESCCDIGYVEVSIDGGTTWTMIDSVYGNQNNWTKRSVDLSQYDGFPEVKIRFRLHTDYSIIYDGWYIDDVEISAYINREAYEYDYDAAGNLISKKDDIGKNISYGYDERNLLTNINYSDTTSVSFSYDCIGNLLNMVNSTGSSVFTYDELNQLLSFTDTFGKYVSYGYGAAGNCTSITYPGSKTVTYAYNAIDKLEEITDWLGNEIIIEWDSVGNLSRIIYPNGIVADMGYDSSNRLISLSNTAPDDSIICSYQYTLDGVGNRTSISMNQPLSPPYPKEEYTYSYEAVNKLTSINGSTTFTYDNHGNIASKISPDGTTTYTYDGEDRLIQVVSNGITSQYSYNGLGHRVSKQVGSQTTRYILDINGPLTWVLAETNENGQITAYYIYGPGIGLISKVTPQGQAYYYHFDGSGNTVCMSDSSGNIINKYAYDEFGNLLGYVETIPNPFCFSGQYGVMDEGNGLLFMRARYYDPEIGRFLSPDPVNLAQLQIMRNSSQNYANQTGINNLFRYGLYNPQTLNAYVYVQNNSINWNDPSGLWYINLNLCYGAGFGITKGITIGDRGIYFYAGPAATVPGVDFTVTYSGAKQTTGWNIGYTAVFPSPVGVAFGAGYTFTGEERGSYGEGGIGFTTPPFGLSGELFYSFPVITWGKESEECY